MKDSSEPPPDRKQAVPRYLQRLLRSFRAAGVTRQEKSALAGALADGMVRVGSWAPSDETPRRTTATMRSAERVSVLATMLTSDEASVVTDIIAAILRGEQPHLVAYLRLVVDQPDRETIGMIAGYREGADIAESEARRWGGEVLNQMHGADLGRVVAGISDVLEGLLAENGGTAAALRLKVRAAIRDLDARQLGKVLDLLDNFAWG